MMISEIYGPVPQGEGPVAGIWSIMLRTGGCDFRCAWCDTPHAVLPENKASWQEMSASDVAREVDAMDPKSLVPLVTITGGNPALWEMDEAVELLHAQGRLVAVETQGSVWKPWIAKCDFIVVAPKPPSSGHTPDDHRAMPLFFDQRADHARQTHMKLTIDPNSEDDVRWAMDLADHVCKDKFIAFVQPVTQAGGDPVAALRDLHRVMVERSWYSAVVLPQIHAVCHGRKRAT